jgi:O-antigen/teichoic acid export membrane protein
VRAPAAMAAGLMLVGLSGYGYLAVTGHSSGPSDAAALAALYFLVGLVTLGVFVGLEQETSRSVSRALAHRRDLTQVTRTAHRHTLVLLALTVAVLLAISPLLVGGPLRGDWGLFGALLVAAASAAAVYVVRGQLGGRQQFDGYAATLATEGLTRLVPCLVIYAAVGGRAPWAYGLAFALALAFAALVGERWLRRTTRPGAANAVGTVDRGDAEVMGSAEVMDTSEGSDDTADLADADLPEAVQVSEFETPERSAAGSLALLVTASLLTQLVANLPPLAASSRLTGNDAVAAAFGQAFVLVRIPLLLTAPVQAMMLPALTRSAAHGEREALRERFRVGLTAVAGLGIVGAALLAMIGPWALRVFFGSTETLSHELLAVLGAGTVFLMLTAILQPTLVALNRHRLVPVAWGVGAALQVVLVLMPIDPVDAAAAGSVGGPLAVVSVMAFVLRDTLRGNGKPGFPAPGLPGSADAARGGPPTDGPWDRRSPGPPPRSALW